MYPGHQHTEEREFPNGWRDAADLEKRAALDFWGKRVEAIIANKRDAKVLTFRARGM